MEVRWQHSWATVVLGKSTIMNLIPRFYDCQKGIIKIDNQDIYKISLKSLRSNISLVSQDNPV